jgi:hypothetical protein
MKVRKNMSCCCDSCQREQQEITYCEPKPVQNPSYDVRVGFDFTQLKKAFCCLLDFLVPVSAAIAPFLLGLASIIPSAATGLGIAALAVAAVSVLLQILKYMICNPCGY